ncbi:MAG: peptidase, partial [Gammaproteobacteria bacterium]|nr:peptidase [Gammaproteobacteria bacterium]
MFLADKRYLRRFLLIAFYTLGALGIVASGGSGSHSGGHSNWVPGVFLPAATFSAKCANPRSGVNPATNQPYRDVKGFIVDENNFLRSYSDDTYLWYNEVVDRDPSIYDSPLVYFDLLKTQAITASGRPRDRFHFTIPSDEWFQLSQSGVSAGYGATFVLLSSTPPREVVVAYTEPGSPATMPLVNLVRGERILTVDGVDINDATQSGTNIINAGLFPESAGENHTFEVLDPGSPPSRMVTITSANVTSTPVQNVGVITTLSGRVGYLLFNDHIATAEQALIDAINQLNVAPGILDLVLDLRYNGGGFLDIASELAYMIAGPVPTAGRPFETLQFNDKHPTTNPVTGQPLSPTPFHTTAQGFSTPAGQALPTLNLPRVYVLAGSGTCSASESIINSLRGVNVEVILIGSTTCGKPYGFYPTDNC